MDSSNLKTSFMEIFRHLEKKLSQLSNAVGLEINKNANIHGILFKILVVVDMNILQSFSDMQNIVVINSIH